MFACVRKIIIFTDTIGHNRYMSSTINFVEGFKYKSFTFAWKNQILYRLPKNKKGRHYPMREVPLIDITDNIQGYRIMREKKTLDQVRLMTDKIDVKVKKSDCKECR